MCTVWIHCAQFQQVKPVKFFMTAIQWFCNIYAIRASYFQRLCPLSVKLHSIHTNSIHIKNSRRYPVNTQIYSISWFGFPCWQFDSWYHGYFRMCSRKFSTQNQIDNRQLASKTQNFSYRVFDVFAISWKSHLCKLSSLFQAAVVTTTRGLTAKTCLHFDSWCPSRCHRRMTSYRPHRWSIDQNVSYLPTTSLFVAKFIALDSFGCRNSRLRRPSDAIAWS